MSKIEQQKESSLADCVFFDSWWNDADQRNYIINTCGNPENTGGKPSIRSEDGTRYLKGHPHGPRDYSCWYPNRGMRYRCGGNPEEIIKCPMAKPKS